MGMTRAAHASRSEATVHVVGPALGVRWMPDATALIAGSRIPGSATLVIYLGTDRRYRPPFDHGGTMPFIRAYAIDCPMCS